MTRMIGRGEKDFMYRLAMIGAARNGVDIKDYYCCSKCTPGGKQRSIRRARRREALAWRRDPEQDPHAQEPDDDFLRWDYDDYS